MKATCRGLPCIFQHLIHLIGDAVEDSVTKALSVTLEDEVTSVEGSVKLVNGLVTILTLAKHDVIHARNAICRKRLRRSLAQPVRLHSEMDYLSLANSAGWRLRPLLRKSKSLQLSHGIFKLNHDWVLCETLWASYGQSAVLPTTHPS